MCQEAQRSLRLVNAEIASEESAAKAAAAGAAL
jgi:hypothetical protein